MHPDKDTLACVEAMHARLGSLETMWDARYVRGGGRETEIIKNSVAVLQNTLMDVDQRSMSTEHARLELVSTFENSEQVEAQTWMTTALYGTVYSVTLKQVVYNKQESMGVECPTTVCLVEVQFMDRHYKKKKYYFTIKFRKATNEQEILLQQPDKTLAEVELDNILSYKEVLGPEVWSLFPAFIMAIRLHDHRTNSVWEGIGMKTLERVPRDSKSTSGFYKAALHCLEKLHRAGASHGSPTLDSFMIKRTPEGTAQLCMTNLCTFRPFPLQNWSAGRCYNASVNDLRSEYNELFITKVMVIMDNLKLFWLKNPRLPMHAQLGEERFNEIYLRKFHNNEARGEHVLWCAPWTPSRLLCFDSNWDIHRMWPEVSAFGQYLKYIDSLSLENITVIFKLCTNTLQMQNIQREFI